MSDGSVVVTIIVVVADVEVGGVKDKTDRGVDKSNRPFVALIFVITQTRHHNTLFNFMKYM